MQRHISDHHADREQMRVCKEAERELDERLTELYPVKDSDPEAARLYELVRDDWRAVRAEIRRMRDANRDEHEAWLAANYPRRSGPLRRVIATELVTCGQEYH